MYDLGVCKQMQHLRFGSERVKCGIAKKRLGTTGHDDEKLYKNSSLTS